MARSTVLGFFAAACFLAQAEAYRMYKEVQPSLLNTLGRERRALNQIVITKTQMGEGGKNGTVSEVSKTHTAWASCSSKDAWVVAV